VVGEDERARAGLVGGGVRVVPEEREQRVRGDVDVLRRGLPREL